MNKADTFSDLGFEEIAPKRPTRAGRAFATEATKGFAGSYGDILDLLHAQLSPEEAVLPGQRAIRQLEQTAPESLQPWLTSDELMLESPRVASSQDVQNLLNMAGIETPELQDEEKFTGRAGRLFGAGAAFGMNPATAGTTALTGATTGQLAEEAGIGPTGQAIAELSGGLAPGITKAAQQIPKAITATTESGLPKIRAVGKEVGKKATISPERQEKAIASLNQEASKLAEKIVEKHVPVSKQIKEGFDFPKRFEHTFGELQRAAKISQAEINPSPIRSFFIDTAEKYQGIPKLHPEAKEILEEMKAFVKTPPKTLYENLKTYRSNNKKINDIYEKSRIEGKKKEYVDFLLDYNRQIANSMEQSLPDDSLWMRIFREENKNYSNYQNAKKVEAQLRPILKGEPTPDKLAKLSTDQRTFEKLELAMGKEGAQEIRQLSTDLKEAHDALKNIPKKELSKWDAILPLGLLLPAKFLTPLGLYKGAQYAKRGYGMFLSSPEKIRDYRAMLQAIKNNDKSAYAVAAAKISREIGKPEMIDWDQLGFEEIQE